MSRPSEGALAMGHGRRGAPPIARVRDLSDRACAGNAQRRDGAGPLSPGTRVGILDRGRGQFADPVLLRPAAEADGDGSTGRPYLAAVGWRYPGCGQDTVGTSRRAAQAIWKIP